MTTKSCVRDLSAEPVLLICEGAYAYFKMECTLLWRQGPPMMSWLQSAKPFLCLAESASTATKLQWQFFRRWHSARCLELSTVLVLCSQTAVLTSESDLATQLHSCASFTVCTWPLEVLIVLCIFVVALLGDTKVLGALTWLLQCW